MKILAWTILIVLGVLPFATLFLVGMWVDRRFRQFVIVALSVCAWLFVLCWASATVFA